MSKFLNILLAFFIAAISFTCKKDKPAPPVINGDCKISSIQHYDDNNLDFTEVFTYDGNKRLIKASKESADFNIAYTSDKIILTHSDGAKTELTLDNDKVTRADDSGGQYETYRYNAEGYLTQIKHFYNATVYDVTDITYNGDNLSTAVKVAFDQSRTVITYEYSTELASSTLFIAEPLYADLIGHFLPGIPFGKQSKNLKVKSRETYIENDPINTSESEIIATFTYEKGATGHYSAVHGKFKEIYSIAGRKLSDSWTERKDITYACD
ncbi:hypothetical protein [Pedobacter endophyticus]|uniref:Uncharacterized protein n=1 Tax=Pedobacter endophyticus TaxID=2789740 RepID=A0A7S9L387_9SPHI|nr:hypothetical protein [Pedobacter endophyticus]QPH41679.1 hypothetical protein IZT61_10685 [Pedobacter endophyticus]